MTKKYRTLGTIWIRGNAIEAGSIVELTKGQAKYIGHALKEIVDAPAAEPAPAPAAPSKKGKAEKAEAADGDER